MNRKIYKVKPNKEQLEVIKTIWSQLEKIEEIYWNKIETLNKQMQLRTGIKDIELFHNDGSVVGVGNVSRTMRLIHRNP